MAASAASPSRRRAETNSSGSAIPKFAMRIDLHWGIPLTLTDSGATGKPRTFYRVEARLTRISQPTNMTHKKSHEKNHITPHHPEHCVHLDSPGHFPPGPNLQCLSGGR